MLGAGVMVLLGIVGAVALLNASEGIVNLIDSGITPLGRIILVLVGTGLAVPLGQRFEADYMGSTRSDLRIAHTTIVMGLAIVLGLGLALYVKEPNVFALPRLVVFYTGLALISVRAWGSGFAWVAPGVAVVAIGLLLPPDAQSQTNVIMSQTNSAVVWLIVVVTAVVGYTATVRR